VPEIHRRPPGRPRKWASEAERKRAYRQRRAAELADPLALRDDARAARADAAQARAEAAAARQEVERWKTRAVVAQRRAHQASERARTASQAAKAARAERDEARQLLTSKLQWAKHPDVLRHDPDALLALVAELYMELTELRRQFKDFRTLKPVSPGELLH
jgi:predicted  nucleic acid-binding Zn-ribbon protein